MSCGTPHILSLIALYLLAILFVAGWSRLLIKKGKSVISGNAYLYSLSISVYCSAWTFFGSTGKAAATGIDFLMLYLGPTLAAFSWFFLLRRIARICRDNSITSIADFISLRYGNSPRLGAAVTLIAFFGAMPLIALQIKTLTVVLSLSSGVVHNFVEAGETARNLPFEILAPLAITLVAAAIFIAGGKRQLKGKHEALVAVAAFDSALVLFCMMVTGLFITWHFSDGFVDIFSRFRTACPADYDRLLTISRFPGVNGIAPPFTMLFISISAVMLLPEQFHLMAVENRDERHIAKAMWIFPLYLLLINLFALPIAMSGILAGRSLAEADFFPLILPLLSGNSAVAMTALLGGLAATSGMIIAGSVAISTMLLNHIFMPAVVRLTPRIWSPPLLLYLKRLGIILVIFSGFIYLKFTGNRFILAESAMISFVAISQLLPAMIGGLYWKRGNSAGALSGTVAGFLIWFYTLLIPSLSSSSASVKSLLENGPYGLTLLRPTGLFALSGMDIWSHSLFWSMLFNLFLYISCSLILEPGDSEKEQIHRFIGIFETEDGSGTDIEKKRFSKPVTIRQFSSLVAKFIGEAEAEAAIKEYLQDHPPDENGNISEFDLPEMTRFIEKKLALYVGTPAAGAIVSSFLSDAGSRLEPVYDIFSTVRKSLDQSREALFVRLKASEIINRTLDLQIIMDDLLKLLIDEFSLDIAMIQLKDRYGNLVLKSSVGIEPSEPGKVDWLGENLPYLEMALFDGKAHFVNDTRVAGMTVPLSGTLSERIVSFAHIPIKHEGSDVLGIMSVFSRSISGIFTAEFVRLLSNLAGQLAQSVTIANEIESKERERLEKESALLQNEIVKKEMEIARQIQISLLPEKPPEFSGADVAGLCISAAHVGGDYYDFLQHGSENLDMVIADVSGHSIGAALIMSEARTLLRSHSISEITPAKIMEFLNSRLYDDLTRTELFISLFYARYSSASGRLSYSNGGHNRPILKRKSENCCIELDAEGMLLGIKPSVFFEEKELHLAKGDLILFYTDGLSEAVSPEGEMFGSAGISGHLLDICHLQAKDIVASFYTALYNFTGTRKLHDDVSIMALKIV